MLFHDVHTVSKMLRKLAKSFQTMIQEMFLKGFLITFREIFWQGFGNIFLHSLFIKKSFHKIFFKPIRNIL